MKITERYGYIGSAFLHLVNTLRPIVEQKHSLVQNLAVFMQKWYHVCDMFVSTAGRSFEAFCLPTLSPKALSTRG